MCSCCKSKSKVRNWGVFHGVRRPSRLGCWLIDMRDGQELCHLVTLLNDVLLCNVGGLLSNGESFYWEKKAVKTLP